eukprot:11174365-Lingulodinium_polyedra.AAC.1
MHCVRKLHCAAGHPSNADLRRCVRTARGSQLAQSLCDHLLCSARVSLQRPKTLRPGKVPTDGLQFNEVVQ